MSRQLVRNRWLYAAFLSVVIAAGLASRSELAVHLPVFVATYAGDTLWALAVLLGLCMVFRDVRPSFIAVMALVIAFAVEASQLYQAGWIIAIRSNRLGALVLGEGFKWSDLACYTVGVAIGFAGETVIAFRQSGTRHPGRRVKTRG